MSTRRIQKHYSDIQKCNKSKAQLDLEMKKTCKGPKDGFYIYSWSKNKPKENYILMQKDVGELMTVDTEKGEIISAFFPFVFSGNICSQAFQVYVAQWQSLKDYSTIHDIGRGIQG